MGREIRLVRALADEGYQYGLNDGKPPIPRDGMVTFAQLPKHLAWRFMAEIEAGGIPVILLRGAGPVQPGRRPRLRPARAGDGRDARPSSGTPRRATTLRRRGRAWREAYAREHGWTEPPEAPTGA